MNWKQGFMKGLIWEILGIIILFILIRELKVFLIYFLIRIILFYPYTKLWKKLMMTKYKKPWYQSKAVWAGIGGCVAVVTGFVVGEMTLGVAIPAFFTSMSIIFLRTGIEGTK